MEVYSCLELSIITPYVNLFFWKWKLLPIRKYPMLQFIASVLLTVPIDNNLLYPQREYHLSNTTIYRVNIITLMDKRFCVVSTIYNDTPIFITHVSIISPKTRETAYASQRLQFLSFESISNEGNVGLSIEPVRVHESQFLSHWL
jgi:hypothetical protein